MSFSPLAKEAMIHSIEKRWSIPVDVELPIDTPIQELIKLAEQEAQYKAAMERVDQIFKMERIRLPPLTPIKEEIEE